MRGTYMTLTALCPEPAPVAAVTAPKVSEETPKKSIEKPADETPAAAEEVKESKKSKSRSRSRGPLGFFKTKKEEVKEKAESEDKKEETPATEPAVAESTPAGMFNMLSGHQERILII